MSSMGRLREILVFGLFVQSNTCPATAGRSHVSDGHGVAQTRLRDLGLQAQ
jgi:hypothetical protein